MARSPKLNLVDSGGVEQAISELNEALLAKAVEAKVLKTNRLRADTTVVEANVTYPSDSSLLVVRRGR